MSDAVGASARPRPARRGSVLTAVLRLAAVATIAATLIWSVLFVDLARRRADTARVQPSSAPAYPGDSQAPAPVTTRAS